MAAEERTIWDRLCDPFPAEAVSWRVGNTSQAKDKGMALAYIDSRDVQDRLDMVCGPENWECRYPHAAAKTVCEIAIWVDGRGWVVKADGAGDSDFEAEKGALSDAFKRAAVKWGIGRYLYGLDSPWVAIEPMGKSYKIAASEYPKLRALLSRKGAPERTISAGVSAPMNAPNPTTKMQAGDLTVTQLGDAMSKAMADIDAAEGDPVTLQLVLSKNKPLIEQLIRRKPAWYWYEDDPAKGTRGRIFAAIEETEKQRGIKLTELRNDIEKLERVNNAAAA